MYGIIHTFQGPVFYLLRRHANASLIVPEFTMFLLLH
jgi:hypothetical protein